MFTYVDADSSRGSIAEVGTDTRHSNSKFF